MTPFTDLLAACAPTEAGATAPVPADWGQGRAIFGGLLTGHALTALRPRVPADRALRSVLCSFVAPAAPGEVSVSVSVLRAGRAMTQAEARITQGGAVKAVVVAAYGASRPTSLAVAGAAAPADIPSDDGLPMVHIDSLTPPFCRGFEYRYDPATVPFSGASQPVLRGSVRLAGGDQPVGEAAVLALLDAWPAPLLTQATGPVAASTVTWMVDLLEPVPEGGWPADAWWRFRSETARSAGGYADISGRMWGPDGRVVAASRQLVVEFSA